MNSESDMLEFAKKVTLKAGRHILKNLEKVHDVKFKNQGKKKEIVTNVDLESENIIISAIKKKYPTHSIWSEEREFEDNKSKYVWVIDPLDGTNNFNFGLSEFGVCVGLWKNNKPFIGVVNLPKTSELFWAKKGKGAFLNGKKIHVNNKKLEESLMLLDTNIIKHESLLKKTRKLINNSYKIRTIGACSVNLTHLARGTASTIIDLNKKPGDFGAGAIIITEAGGIITTMDKKPLSLKNNDIIATNKKVYNTVMKLLS